MNTPPKTKIQTVMKNVSLIAASSILMATLLGGCGTVPPTPQEAAAKAPMAASDLSYSNKWRIEVSEGANSDGEFIFRVTPKGGETQVVTVKVNDGESENNVARTIKDAFEYHLHTGKYQIEIDDGEDVLIKRDLTEPQFAMEIVSSTVKSVRLDLESE